MGWVGGKGGKGGRQSTKKVWAIKMTARHSEQEQPLEAKPSQRYLPPRIPTLYQSTLTSEEKRVDCRFPLPRPPAAHAYTEADRRERNGEDKREGRLEDDDLQPRRCLCESYTDNHNNAHG